MGSYVANQVVKLLIKKFYKITTANILILGITFKENCPDIRNSKVIDVIRELMDFGCSAQVYDPLVDPWEVRLAYGIELLDTPETLGKYEDIVLALADAQFRHMDSKQFIAQNGIVFDVKNFLSEADGSL